MLQSMSFEGNVSVNNLVQTIVQYPAFLEMINSILTTTNQKQLTDISLIALPEIPECKGIILPFSFYRQLSDY